MIEGIFRQRSSDFPEVALIWITHLPSEDPEHPQQGHRCAQPFVPKLVGKIWIFPSLVLQQSISVCSAPFLGTATIVTSYPNLNIQFPLVEFGGPFWGFYVSRSRNRRVLFFFLKLPLHMRLGVSETKDWSSSPACPSAPRLARQFTGQAAGWIFSLNLTCKGTFNLANSRTVIAPCISWQIH